MTYPATVPSIALIGKAGSGKTTAAKLLMERFNLGYERLSFAAALKVGCCSHDDRDLLQRVGQGVRDLHADFWVNLALADLQRRDEARYNARFVCDDCRYPNELQALMAYGFVTIRIAAPVVTRLARLRGNGRLTDPEQLNHVSETALDDYATDYRILNDGNNPDHLATELASILNKASL